MSPHLLNTRSFLLGYLFRRTQEGLLESKLANWRRIEMRTQRLLAAITIPALLAVSAVHAAQPAYPDRPIRLIIGSAPGSGPDII
jgi:hypothetical protein